MPRGYVRSREVPRARPNREFAPSATITYRARTASVTPRLLVADDRARDQAVLHDRLDRLGGRQQGGAGLDRPLGDHLVELAPPNYISVGREVGVLGPGQLEGDAMTDRAQTVESLERP